MPEDEKNINTVQVEMDVEQALMYKEFCKHYKLFKYLQENGVFTHRLGKVILHYSNDGRKLGVHKEDRSREEFIFPTEDENNLTEL